MSIICIRCDSTIKFKHLSSKTQNICSKTARDSEFQSYIEQPMNIIYAFTNADCLDVNWGILLK